MSQRYCPPPADCPNCGKVHGAAQSCSKYNHMIPCCSDKCSRAVHDTIAKNKESKAYQKAVGKHQDAIVRVRNLRYKGINMSHSHDNLDCLGRGY